MGFLTGLKAQKAYRLQQKGQKGEAERLYEEAFAEGLDDPRYNLAYALLIIRKGEYQKAKDFLVKHQKSPGMTPEQRTTLLVDYAACCFRLGSLDKGISALEQQFRKMQNGLLYQTLGYLYVEKYDAARRPDFEKEAEQAALPQEQPEDAGETGGDEETGNEEKPAGTEQLSPREAWEAGVEKTEAFIRESLEYDDEDPICLDNMGQFLYRDRENREEAKSWFEKAYAIKDSQIDTLYFLSRYDLEAGDRDAALEKLEKAAAGRFSPLNYCSRETIKEEIARLKGEN
jgi:tetratricopeptide (TPR) repeat protein